MQDKIIVHEDKKLSQLTNQMNLLETEEAGFFHDQNTTNVHGRTLKDVAKDMIIVYRQTNLHLESHYSDNDVAKRWIAVNEFSARSVEETWL